MDDVWVNPGEIITSHQRLATELGKSVQQIRTLLKKLKASKTISILSTRGYTHIKLEKYWIPGNGNKKSNKANNTQSTPKQHPNNSGATTNKEYKKKRKKERSKKSDFVFESFEKTKPRHRLTL